MLSREEVRGRSGKVVVGGLAGQLVPGRPAITSKTELSAAVNQPGERGRLQRVGWRGKRELPASRPCQGPLWHETSNCRYSGPDLVERLQSCSGRTDHRFGSNVVHLKVGELARQSATCSIQAVKE